MSSELSIYDRVYLKEGLSATQRLVLDLVGKNKNVLEVGCGSGHMTKVLTQEQACQITAVELDTNMAQRATPFCKKIYTGSIESTDIQDRIRWEFDVILFIDVLEHLIKPGRVLQVAQNWLKPNGHIIVSLPNIAFVKIRLQLLFGRFEYADSGILDKTHLHFYTIKSAKELLASNGYLVRQMILKNPYFPRGFLSNTLIGLLPNLFTANIIMIGEPSRRKHGTS